MLLTELAEASAAVAGTSARSAKIERIAALLSRVPPGEVPAAVAFLSGELLQGQIGVGYAALSELLRRDAAAQADPGLPDAPPAGPGLTLSDTDAAFEAIGRVTGPGSQAERRSAAGRVLRPGHDERTRVPGPAAGR